MSEAVPTEGADRAVRVFVSSTFRDMVAERNELGRRTFVELRRFCEARDVIFTDVDLRWGISEEQQAEGQVLTCCFDEIHNCRPFFIGLLGERYGSLPTEVPADLIAREPWLEAFRHRSVTELEIVHGVLRDPGMATHAFFYVRDPAWIDALPAERQVLYRELPTAEDIRQLGRTVAIRQCAARRLKLKDLKAAIAASGFPVRTYRGPEELGALVLDDLKRVVDRIFPEGSRPEPLEREQASHRSLARRLGRIFVGRQDERSRLDAHAGGDGPPLVVIGDEGIGKSALLARWAADYRQRHPDEAMFVHFVGASPESTDWSTLVRRALGTIGGDLQIGFDARVEPDALRRAFGAALERAAHAGRLVLVIDNLSGLDDRDLAQDLVWLPAKFPGSLRVVLSTAAGRPLAETTRRGWPTLAVGPLSEGERRELVSAYLRQYAKTLSTHHLEEIVQGGQTGHPLFTRTLLEEVRLCGEHATLGRMLRTYLDAGSAVGLFDKVLERYEADYQRERPGLVQDAMSLLWAARRGLSETELLEMLKIGDDRLPRAHWSPLYLAAESLLLDRSGLLTLSHDFLRQAVEQRYLPSPEQRTRIHRYLAHWYSRLDLSRRTIEELPWHLMRSQSWNELATLLAAPPFLHAACADNRGAVRSYLAAIERESELTVRDVFASVLAAPAADPRMTWEVGGLLGDLGYAEDAQRLTGALAQHYEVEDTTPHREASFETIERRLDEKVASGEFATMNPFAEMQRDVERIRAKLLHKASLENEAAALMAAGRSAPALALLKEAERICRDVGQEKWLVGNLVNQGLALEEQGDLDAATDCYREQERIARQTGEQEGLADALSGRGRVLRATGETRHSLAVLEEEERLRREIADGEGLLRCLGARANLLEDEGRHEEALQLHRELERNLREAGDAEGQATSLQNQAAILLRTNRPADGRRAYEEQERIARRHGLHAHLAAALQGRGSALYIEGQPDAALAVLREAEQLCHTLGLAAGELECLVREALIHVERPGGLGDCQAALANVRDLERRHQLSAAVSRLKPLLDVIREKAAARRPAP